MPNYKRTDSSHAPIRDALRKAGWRVFDTSSGGVADLLVVLKSGRAAIIVEAKPEKGGKITPQECRYMLQLVDPAYRIFTDPQEAVDIMSEIEEGL